MNEKHSEIEDGSSNPDYRFAVERARERLRQLDARNTEVKEELKRAFEALECVDPAAARSLRRVDNQYFNAQHRILGPKI